MVSCGKRTASAADRRIEANGTDQSIISLPILEDGSQLADYQIRIRYHGEDGERSFVGAALSVLRDPFMKAFNEAAMSDQIEKWSPRGTTRSFCKIKIHNDLHAQSLESMPLQRSLSAHSFISSPISVMRDLQTLLRSS